MTGQCSVWSLLNVLRLNNLLARLAPVLRLHVAHSARYTPVGMNKLGSRQKRADGADL